MPVPKKPKPAAPIVAADPAFPAYVVARVDSLVGYANNPRTHSPAQIDQLVASIREFGFTNAILTDGKNGVVAGHGRLVAAQRLGMVTVPTLELSHLSAAQRRAYIIADNKLALAAGWDDDLLRLELGALREDGFDLSLIGFDAGELAGLFGDAQGLTDPDEVPPVPAVPVSMTGDVWLLGRHRVICGDSTKPAVLDLVLAGVRPQLCLTDPPYGNGEAYDRFSDTKGELIELVARFLPLVRARCEVVLLTPGNANQRMYPAPEWTLAWFTPAGIGSSVWGYSCWQPIMAFGRDPYLKRGRGRRPDALILPGAPPLSDELVLQQDEPVFLADAIVHTEAADNKLGHPCPKPIKVWSHFMKRGSVRVGDHVLDPFVGSGTTIIAAEMTGRACHAIEISPAYIDVSVLRWQEFTGQQAAMESSGQTFAEVAASRVKAEAA
jgi:DNA methylase/ParB-like nuclease domain